MDKKYLTNLLIIILFIVLPVSGNSKKIGHNLLIEDIRQLAGIFEASHPDPYVRGGGKIAFHRRLADLMLSIPEAGMTKKAFQTRLLPFVAAIGDGHTRIHVKYHKNEIRPGGIPLYFSIVEKSLVVSQVVQEDNKNLIGSLLLAVENISFRVLCKRVTQLRGTDNEYSALTLLAGKNYLWYKSQLSNLIPEWQTDELSVQLRLPSGETKKITFTLPIQLNQPLIKAKSRIQLPSTKICEFAYRFLDGNTKIAILKVDGMFGFRENFELVGLDSQYRLDGARYYYQRYNKKAPPDEKSELIKGIPSATETFKSLVIEMKNNKTETLIIDLRQNGGGNSTLANFLCYFLYGKDRLINYFSQKSGYEIIKYSDLYFEEVKESKKGKQKNGIRLNNNDYWFEELYEPKRFEISNIKNVYEKFYKKIPSFYKEYKSGKFSHYYEPKKIMVLCSPYTYSSGYTMMKMLNVMGATLIGIPSSQNENAPGWILNYKLKNSGLTGWVACKFYTSFSQRIKNGVYQPDHQLTYNQFKKYKFDPNWEILFSLDL